MLLCLCSVGVSARRWLSTFEEYTAGLKPHHATGSTKEDPLLFKHTYQQHDPLLDRLMYYQYEARRHAHVVILDDVAVLLCEAEPRKHNETLVTLHLAVNQLRQLNVSNSSIVVANDLKCTTQKGMWQVGLRARVVADPIIDAVDVSEAALHLLTVPAALHECFAYSHVEFFHGSPSKLRVARANRERSLASKGMGTRPEQFASTDKIIADAKAAAAIKQKEERAHKVAARNAEREQRVDDSSRVHNHSRGLSHRWPCVGGLGRDTDYGVELVGTDCSALPIPTREDCYWRRGEGSDEEWLLMPGNSYTLRWRAPVDGNVEIKMVEVDGGGYGECSGNSARSVRSGKNRENEWAFTLGDISGCRDWVSL